MGASEIYPTVMVDGKIPAKDCEFVSVFSVSGQIFIISGSSDCVYLRLKTDWMEDKVVVFDLLEKRRCFTVITNLYLVDKLDLR